MGREAGAPSSGAYCVKASTGVADAHSKTFRTVGLPIPIGASYLMAVVLIRDRIDPIGHRNRDRISRKLAPSVKHGRS